MKKVTLVLLALCFGLFAAPVWAAPPVQQVENKCLITAPANGSQVRGQVAVQGSATHPGFTWYQVGYAPDPNPTGEW